MITFVKIIDKITFWTVYRNAMSQPCFLESTAKDLESCFGGNRKKALALSLSLEHQLHHQIQQASLSNRLEDLQSFVSFGSPKREYVQTSIRKQTSFG